MYYSLSAIISNKMQRVFQLTNHTNAFPKDNQDTSDTEMLYAYYPLCHTEHLKDTYLRV